MRYYKSRALGGATQIRDHYGNVCAFFTSDTYGRASYNAFCRGLPSGVDLYDSDYNRMIIGTLDKPMPEKVEHIAK